MSPETQLDPTSIAQLADAIAVRVAARLAEAIVGPARGDLLSAAEVARELDVSPGWVYGHQKELGVQRLGSGAKPRLRFHRWRIEQFLATTPGSAKGQPKLAPVVTPRPLPPATRLLPIRGGQQ